MACQLVPVPLVCAGASSHTDICCLMSIVSFCLLPVLNSRQVTRIALVEYKGNMQAVKWSVTVLVAKMLLTAEQ